MDLLPDELVLIILDYLEFSDIKNLSLINKKYFLIANDQQYWKLRSLNRFGIFYDKDDCRPIIGYFNIKIYNDPRKYLSIGINNSNPQLLRISLKYMADIFIKMGHDGYIKNILEKQNFELVEVLLESDKFCIHNILCQAVIQNSNDDIINLLLEDERSHIDQYRYFILAIKDKNKRIINLLLHHFDFNFTNHCNVKIFWDDTNIVNFLITEFENLIDLHQILNTIILYKRTHLIELILTYSQFDHNRIFLKAIEVNYVDLVKLLIEKHNNKIDINEGLLLATNIGDSEIIKLLTDSYCDN